MKQCFDKQNLLPDHNNNKSIFDVSPLKRMLDSIERLEKKQQKKTRTHKKTVVIKQTKNNHLSYCKNHRSR